jgi:hypothetical protein
MTTETREQQLVRIILAITRSHGRLELNELYRRVCASLLAECLQPSDIHRPPRNQ